MIDEHAIGERFRAMAGELDERRRRLWAGAEALSHGRGGQAAVIRATGLAHETVRRGMREIMAGESIEAGRVRERGGGRKALTETDPALLADLERLVADEARGDPESPLRWTAKSTRALARALREQGHEIHFASVAKYLRQLGYSLQANRKTKEGTSHPDRDAQFRHINAKVKAALDSGEPAILVDTKKKELVGDFKNAGQQWRLKGDPRRPRRHRRASERQWRQAQDRSGSRARRQGHYPLCVGNMRRRGALHPGRARAPRAPSSRGDVEAVSESTQLTTGLADDLRRAIARQGCPVCRVLRSGEERYWDGLLYEGFQDHAVLSAYGAAAGLCARHLAQLSARYDPFAAAQLAHASLQGAIPWSRLSAGSSEPRLEPGIVNHARATAGRKSRAPPR